MASPVETAHQKVDTIYFFIDTRKNNMKLDEVAQKYQKTIDLFMKLKSRHNNGPPVSRILAMNESTAFKCAQKEVLATIQPFQAQLSHHW